MTHEKCQEFTKRTLKHMLSRLQDYQEQYGDLYNLEATPPRAPATPPRQARRGALSRHHHRRRAGRDPLLHQQLPPARGLHRGHLRRPRHPGRAADPLHLRHRLPRLPGREAARLAGRRGPRAQDSRELQAALLHAQPQPTPSARTDGYLAGEQFTCPHCGESAEVYSRITGYYRPVQNWNAGKTQEYRSAGPTTSPTATSTPRSTPRPAAAARSLTSTGTSSRRPRLWRPRPPPPARRPCSSPPRPAPTAPRGDHAGQAGLRL